MIRSYAPKSHLRRRRLSDSQSTDFLGNLDRVETQPEDHAGKHGTRYRFGRCTTEQLGCFVLSICGDAKETCDESCGPEGTVCCRDDAELNRSDCPQGTEYSAKNRERTSQKSKSTSSRDGNTTVALSNTIGVPVCDAGSLSFADERRRL